MPIMSVDMLKTKLMNQSMLIRIEDRLGAPNKMVELDGNVVLSPLFSRLFAIRASAFAEISLALSCNAWTECRTKSDMTTEKSPAYYL